MTSAITAFKSNDGIEIYIDTNTGESYCSVSGYADMVGFAKTEISRRVRGYNLKASRPCQLTEILTAGGVQRGYMIPDYLIAEWAILDAPELAAKFTTIGVRMYLHQLAGYQVTSTAMLPNLTRRQMLEQLLEAEIQLEAKNKEIDSLVEQVTTLEPKAIAWDNIADKDGLIQLNDFAGALGMGRTTLTRKLVDLGIFFKEGNRNRAYAKYVKQGYCVERMFDVCSGYKQTFSTYLTKTGAEWLAQKLTK